MVVNTPALYDQLKKGQFDGKYESIYVKPEAHPNVIREPKHFANTTFRTIIFTDEHTNTVSLYPRIQRLEATYFVGDGLYLGLPDSYVGYWIVSYGNVVVTDDELNYILQWKKTLQLDIRDRSNVAFELMQRAEQINEMKNLENFSASIQRKSYKELDVRGFLRKMETLKSASFICNLLPRNEFHEFVKKQEAFDDWKLTIPFTMKKVVYERK